MKAKIDRSACIGCMQCAEICPQVFCIDDEERAVVCGEETAELEEKTTQAAASCPVAAIELED